jgi:hypothetical protein
MDGDGNADSTPAEQVEQAVVATHDMEYNGQVVALGDVDLSFE